MANIDLGNLTRYDGKIKEYAEDKYLSKNTANWQMTEKAGTVTCYPVPDTELEPIVDFSFKEVPPTSGEKSPSNPSTIEGVNSIGIGNITNLYSLVKSGSYTNNNVTFATDADGILTINGTASAETRWTRYINNTVLGKTIFPAGTKLYFKIEILSGSYTLPDNTYFKMQFSVSYANGTSWYPGVGIGSVTNLEEVFTAQHAFKILSSSLNVPTGMVCNNLKVRCLVELHDVSNKSWYPQKVNEYTINLGGTYYGGSVNLATGLMMVTHGQYAFNGTEQITSWTVLENVGRAAFPLGGITALRGGVQSCTHLPYASGWTGDYTHFYVNINEEMDGAIIFAPYFTQEAMKTWMASEYANGTPVTIVWTLRQPFTVQLTPMQIKSLFALDKNTPRLNTLYTDADSVQVGYQKHPARTSYELENAILALGGGE